MLCTWEFFSFDLFSDFNWDFTLLGTLLSLSFGHISLLLIESKEDVVICFKNGTILLSVIMDMLLIAMILFEADIKFKLIAILSILIVLGTIVTLLLNKLNNKVNVISPNVVNQNVENPNIENIAADKYSKLEKLKSLLVSNAITQEEYDSEKTKILNS